MCPLHFFFHRPLPEANIYQSLYQSKQLKTGKSIKNSNQIS